MVVSLSAGNQLALRPIVSRRRPRGSNLVTLELSPDERLTTTRSVRKRLDFDRPVDMCLVRQCLEIAIQAPTGSNKQGWHFLLEDPELRTEIAGFYKRAWDAFRQSPAFSAYTVHDDEPEMRAAQDRMVSSVSYLANHLARVPVFVIPCVAGRVESTPQPFAVATQVTTYGSIIPAAWSFMLAARAGALVRRGRRFICSSSGRLPSFSKYPSANLHRSR
jgi:nitroreductase